MKNSTLLEKIKAMLSNEIKLEQMLMGDGVTKIEAETLLSSLLLKKRSLAKSKD